jgi:ADP-ribose pyrophosphatase YjhB (NUDIX family)
MAIEINLHPIQAKILLKLLFSPLSKFSELNTESLPSDHFNFHIKKLIELQIIEKGNEGKYVLTSKGKEFANRLDTDIGKVERQAKIGVLVVPTKIKGKVKYYMMQKRLKEPYFGYIGFVTGKLRWGESVIAGAARELKEETGLEGQVKLSGIKHKMDYKIDDELLEDKFFLVFSATDLRGKLKNKFEGGENFWTKEEDVEKLENLFDGVMESIRITIKKDLIFEETKYKVKGY